MFGYLSRRQRIVCSQIKSQALRKIHEREGSTKLLLENRITRFWFWAKLNLGIWIVPLLWTVLFVISIAVAWGASHGFHGLLRLENANLPSNFAAKEVLARLAVFGVAIFFGLLASKQLVHQEILMMLPLPDSALVGSVWKDVLKAFGLVGLPLSVSYAAVYYAESPNFIGVAIHAGLFAIFVALSTAAGQEWFRRCLPRSGWVDQACTWSMLVIIVLLYSDAVAAVSPDFRLATFGASTLQTVQWLPPVGWYLSSVMYLTSLSELFPVGGLLGAVAILSYLWSCRSGYRLLEFRWDARGLVHAIREEHRYQDLSWRTAPVAANLKMDWRALAGPWVVYLASCLDRFKTFHVRPGNRTLPHRRIANGSLGLMGMPTTRSWSIREGFWWLAMCGYTGFLIYVSHHRWLGSATTLLFSPWIFCSVVFMLSNLGGVRSVKGNFLFAECYLPIDLLRTFGQQYFRLRKIVAIKLLLIGACLVSLYVHDLPLAHTVLLGLIPLHSMFMIHARPFLAASFHGSDIRFVLIAVCWSTYILCCYSSIVVLVFARTQPWIGVLVLSSSMLIVLACVAVCQWIVNRGWVDHRG